MTSLKTAQEKARELNQDYIITGMPDSEMNTLVATIYTDLLDSIEADMGGEKEIKKDDAVTYTMMDEGYNTAHRKFLAVIKEHRV